MKSNFVIRVILNLMISFNICYCGDINNETVKTLLFQEAQAKQVHGSSWIILFSENVFSSHIFRLVPSFLEVLMVKSYII